MTDALAAVLVFGGVLLMLTVMMLASSETPELAGLLIGGVVLLALVVVAVQHPFVGAGIGVLTLGALAIVLAFRKEAA